MNGPGGQSDNPVENAIFVIYFELVLIISHSHDISNPNMKVILDYKLVIGTCRDHNIYLKYIDSLELGHKQKTNSFNLFNNT